MKKLSITLLGIFSISALFAQTAKTVVNVTANVTANTTWTADKIYLLSGIIRIADGATLTIEPGTVVKGGQAPDQSNATCLLVDKGGKLNAIGTKDKPIIFTSGQPKGQRDFGDWGGIVMFGKAPANKTNPQYEGGVIPGTYGGTDAADNSGTLKYVRIEFAGYPFEQDRELNSLTMCAIGNGTTIDFVQCSYNFDDAFEWFGGSVNAKHLVAYRTNDDDFDVDQGFSGRVQFGVSIADPAVADVSTKNGFEIDNDAGGTTETPKTSAVFSNMTIIGAFKDTSDTRPALHGRGAHIRRNSEVSIFNSVWMGWREGIRMDGINTFSNYNNGIAFLQNNIIAGNKTNFNGSGGVPAANFQNFYDSTANNNRKFSLNSQVMLKDAFNFSNPDFTPSTGSPVLTGASFANAKLGGGFFTTTTHVGAFAENDTWLNDWTEFDPNNAEYDLLPADTTTIGLTKIESVLNLNVYPNPAANTLNVEFDLLNNQNVNVQVIDITGRNVMTIAENAMFSTGAHKLNADITSLINGIYFVQIQSEAGLKTIKTVVSK
jgi:hypothetical protein